MIIDVALQQGIFTYKVPVRFGKEIQIGTLVKVPFKSRQLNGWVINIGKTSPDLPVLKEVQDIYLEEVLSPQLIELGKWAAEYYQATPGAFFDLISPPHCESLKIKSYNTEQDKKYKVTGQGTALPTVISDCLRRKEFKSILIWGTQRQNIYLKVVEETLSYGRGTIFLAPEITLSNLIFALLQKKFGNIVALLHSGIKSDIRWQEWQRIKSRYGGIRIVVGTMNAVFAPVKQPGLIIVDEEHNPGYKSEKYPKYSAKTIASMRAKIESCLYIQGSATPGLEAFYRTKKQESSLLRLTSATPIRRVPEVLLSGEPAPCLPLGSGRSPGLPHTKVSVVDMRKEANPIFSRCLKIELEKYVKNKDRILLFLNKKGFSGFILCEDCGYVPRCPNCDIALVYYKADLSLKCRYCNYTTPALGYCPQCKGTNLSRKGIGIAQVEKEFLKLFPGVSILRVDKDTISNDYIKHILKAFEAKEFQVLLGTQIVVKPYLLPNLGLLGVISADTGLNLPDFRTGERVFSLLLQLINNAAQAIVQTYNPSHRVLQYIARQDIIGFYNSELKTREELNYPPYSHLVSVLLSARGGSAYGGEGKSRNIGNKEAQLQEKADKLKAKFQEMKLNFIGPSLLKTPRKTVYHFLIKTQDPKDLHLAKIVPSGTIINVDPV